MTTKLEQVRDWHLEEVRRLNSYRHPFPNDSTVLAALIMHHQSMADAIAARLTQPAQSVDVEKVREGIAYLKKGHRIDAEMADKLTAALQEGE